MKSFLNKFLLITILSSVAILFANCKDENNPSSPPGHDSDLVGMWELEEVYVPVADSTVYPQDLGFALTADFMADGKYEITETETGSMPSVETGTWSTANGSLTLTNDSDGEKEIIPYTVNGNVGILKVNYEVQPGLTVPAEFKFMKK